MQQMSLLRYHVALHSEKIIKLCANISISNQSIIVKNICKAPNHQFVINHFSKNPLARPSLRVSKPVYEKISGATHVHRTRQVRVRRLQNGSGLHSFVLSNIDTKGCLSKQ